MNSIDVQVQQNAYPTRTSAKTSLPYPTRSAIKCLPYPTGTHGYRYGIPARL